MVDEHVSVAMAPPGKDGFPEPFLMPKMHQGKCVICHQTVTLEGIEQRHRFCGFIVSKATAFLEEYKAGLMDKWNFSVELVVRDREIVFIGTSKRKRKVFRPAARQKRRKLR